MRVHEELVAGGAAPVVSGADGILPPAWHRTNTGPARGPVSFRAGCGDAARYVSFAPEVEVGGRGKYKAQTASAVLCYSRDAVLPDQPHVSARFDCKIFLSDALQIHGPGACERFVMIDNTHVVVLRGTGREMIPVARNGGLRGTLRFPLCGAPDCANANRSARVERPFSFIENNFSGGPHLR